MKYLLPVLMCLLLLGGCSAGRLSLNDGINIPFLKASRSSATTDVNGSRSSPKEKPTQAVAPEPIEASFSETAYLDRF